MSPLTSLPGTHHESLAHWLCHCASHRAGRACARARRPAALLPAGELATGGGRELLGRAQRADRRDRDTRNRWVVLVGHQLVPPARLAREAALPRPPVAGRN